MSNETSTSPLIVNTSSFCEEDLTTFLECSERILQCEQRQRREWLKKAVKTSEEVFETSVISIKDRTDDDLLKDDPSYMSKSASMNDLLKYFEEDVEVDSDPQPDVKILPRNGEVVAERSVRPSEVKQTEMKSARNERKQNAIENAARGGKPKRQQPLSEIRQSDVQFIDIEPSVFKPNDGDTCLKPSDLKAKGRRSNELKMRSPTPKDLPQPDVPQKNGTLSASALRRKFFNLTDHEDEPKPINRNIRFAETVEQLKAAAPKGGLKPRLDGDLITNVKLSDLNFTQSEWEARYFDIIKNDLRPKKVLKPTDLNLTQQQWDERYFQIIRNDLKPVDVLTPPKTKPPPPPSEDQPQARTPAARTKIKSKVQKMADMFNGMVTQVLKRQPAIAYTPLSNEFSPEAPQPKARSLPISVRKSPVPSPRVSKRNIRQTGCLISEEVFTKLSVKDKVTLFNKFMREMTRMNPDFSNNLPEEVKAEFAEAKVLSEKQESVKSLARELEARITFPKQTVSEAAMAKLRRVPSKKGPAPQPPVEIEKANIQDEEEQIHVSTLTVVLKPSPEKACAKVSLGKKPKIRGVPLFRRQVKSPTVVVCPSMKRSSKQLCSSVPIDIYGPPRKIRRTRPERTNSKKFFKSPYLERMFYEWMKERHGLSFDIKASAPVNEVAQEDSDKTDEAEVTLKNEDVDAPKEDNFKPQKPPRAHHPKNEETDSQKENIQPEKPPRALFKSDPSESDSSLMTMPSSKVTTDDSQTDQPKESPTEFEFLKPVRPPRRKKVKRTTLTWKKDASIVEKLPLSTTDSDSDYKQLELLAQQQKPKKPADQNDQLKVKKITSKGLAPTALRQSFEADEAFLDFMNSPRKIRNAYTLTAMTSPSQDTESGSSMISEQPPKPPRKQKAQLPHAIDEANFENEDQGFETGSNEFSPVRVVRKSATKSSALEKSPLFIKLNAELERRFSEANQNPSAYSTPLKGNPATTTNTPLKKSSWHTVFSPIQSNRRRSLNDSETRRSSILMDVIREEHHGPESHRIKPDIEDDVFQPSTPSTDENQDKSSSFWISVGEFTISMAIFENPPDRLHLLHDIFTQKSAETHDVRFGVDDFKYSPKDGITKEEITKSLPKIDGISHYWVATGDLAVPFQGNFMAPEKINRTFGFIRESVSDDSQLSFGVDDFEFSQIPEPMTPKFSIESSYSMLIGLNGQRMTTNDRHSKFTWPSNSQNSTPLKTSDLDPSEFDSDGFDPSEIGRLSFSPYGSNYFDMVSMRSGERTSVASFESLGSPEMFSLEYENEPLDKIFNKNPKPEAAAPNSQTFQVEKSVTTPKDSMSIEKMIETIRQQQQKLQNIETQMKAHTKPTELTNIVMDKFKGGQNVKKLQNIVKSIQIIGKTGFENCTPQQLESFLYFLSLYAETCLSTCSDHIHKILDKLMEERSVVV